MLFCCWSPRAFIFDCLRHWFLIASGMYFWLPQTFVFDRLWYALSSQRASVRITSGNWASVRTIRVVDHHGRLFLIASGVNCWLPQAFVLDRLGHSFLIASGVRFSSPWPCIFFASPPSNLLRHCPPTAFSPVSLVGLWWNCNRCDTFPANSDCEGEITFFFAANT